MDIAATIQTWINVLTHPDEATFALERQKPDATLSTAIIWMVIAGVVTAILGFIAVSLALSAQAPMFQQMIDQMDLPPQAQAQLRQLVGSGVMSGLMGGASVASVILTPIFFLIGVGIRHLIARMLGGTGEFGNYAYLNAVYQAPLTIVQAVVSLVPFLGGCVSLIATIYGLVLAYYATKVGHNLSSGKAIAVVIIPILIVLVLFGCLFVAIFGLVASTVGNQ